MSHFDNQNLDDYPLTFAAGDFPDFRDEWDKTSLSRSWNTSLNLPYPPAELAGILAGILQEAGVEIRYEVPRVPAGHRRRRQGDGRHREKRRGL